MPTVVVQTDSLFYGADGSNGRVCYGYDRRSWANVRNALAMGGLGGL